MRRLITASIAALFLIGAPVSTAKCQGWCVGTCYGYGCGATCTCIQPNGPGTQGFCNG